MVALSRSRRAVVSLELLVALPVLIIVLLGIIELSLIYEVDKRAAYASRFGAKLASETTRDPQQPIHLANLGSSGMLRRQLESHLQSAGLTGICGVILEHNACVGNPLQEDISPGCECRPPRSPLPGGERGESASAAYARVTVCIPLDGNVADLLPSFGGFTIAHATLTHSTLFRIEDDNHPPQASFTTHSASVDSGNLPVATPPTGLLEFRLPAPAGSTFPLSFDASLSTDREEPTASLTFQWAIDTDGDGSLETTRNGVQAIAGFSPPAAGSQREYTAVLTVTDSCSADAQTKLRIRVRRDST